MSDFQQEFNAEPKFPKAQEPEETIEQMEARLGVHGNIRPEFKGKGVSAINMGLSEFGLAVNATGEVVDLETGKTTGDSLYEE